MRSVTIKRPEHNDRIKEELRKSGISSFGLLRFTARYLPRIIHKDEHIQAAVFGRHKESEGLFGYAEGILIATDMRVIYLDHRPGYTTMDEIAYDVISGVNISHAGIYTSLKLFTKIANYTISFAKLSCVKRFADYIEMQRIDLNHPSTPPPAVTNTEVATNNEAFTFLKRHTTAVLSTTDRTGNITGAAVYYTFDNKYLYVLTKEGTKKARNIMSSPRVALTIYDSEKLQTLQIQATATVEQDPTIKDFVYQQIIKPYQKPRDKTPPVAKIQSGGYVVFRIMPEQLSYSDFSD